MTLRTDESPARLADAMAGLEAALTAVARDVVARIDERCPYRGRADRCTFAGGCVNQRRARRGRESAAREHAAREHAAREYAARENTLRHNTACVDAVHCAGDHQLRRASR